MMGRPGTGDIGSIAASGEAAELYFHRAGAGFRKSVSYRRFASMADAVSFVMESVSPRDHSSCFLELGERRLGYKQMRDLYQDVAFPGKRRPTGECK